MTEYQKAQVRAKYDIISKALARHKNNKSKAAADLKMNRKTIYNVIAKYQLLERVE